MHVYAGVVLWGGEEGNALLPPRLALGQASARPPVPQCPQLSQQPCTRAGCHLAARGALGTPKPPYCSAGSGWSGPVGAWWAAGACSGSRGAGMARGPFWGRPYLWEQGLVEQAAPASSRGCSGTRVRWWHRLWDWLRLAPWREHCPTGTGVPHRPPLPAVPIAPSQPHVPFGGFQRCGLAPWNAASLG